MNKKSIYIFISCIILIIILEVVIECIIYKRGNETKDNILFYRMYPEVGQNNIYKIVDITKGIDILSSGTGIVFFGFPSCAWCQKYVPVLNEAAIEYDIKEIYYVDIKYDRKNNTEKYIELLRLLNTYLAEGKTLYVPDVYFVKSGNIIGHNNDTATFEEVKVEEYYTEENRAILKQRLINYIKQIKPAVCNDETKECT